MSAKIYVGNLSWSTTDDALREAFSSYGNVLDSIVMRDRETGRSRGFGFVTYSSQMEADAAIQQLNEQELDGRRIKVNLANARTTGGGGGGGGYGGGYGGGGSGPAGQYPPSGYNYGSGSSGSGNTGYGPNTGGYGGYQPNQSTGYGNPPATGGYGGGYPNPNYTSQGYGTGTYPQDQYGGPNTGGSYNQSGYGQGPYGNNPNQNQGYGSGGNY